MERSSAHLRDQHAMPRALIDASSAILLAKAGLIESCSEAFTLIMTQSVFDEVTTAAHPDAARLSALAGRQPGIIVRVDPGKWPSDPIQEDFKRLHRGERDTLYHYLRGAARFVIIDDGKGLQVCRRLGVPHVNALLCPKLLQYCGRMPDRRRVRSYMDRIVGLGRYSASVVDWAQACRRADLEFFVSNMQRSKST